jgi:ornithine cyclodeaminase/alanine dehydrogenase-like protein (mu-crystallin family)
MPLFLRENDITRVLEMDRVIAAVEEAFTLLGQGRALNRPRRRVQNPDGSVLHVMSAALPTWGVMGLKAYTSAPSGTRFVGLLYSTDTGELLALMEAHRLGQMRTGAASAVATRHMARREAGSLGLIGTGWQARGQVIAISRVRPVALVKCYSRTPDRREQFAQEMVRELGAEVVAVDSAREAVDGVDIVVTATTAREPVLQGEWLQPGMHINAIGSNWAHKQELDIPAVARCQRIAVDDLEQARQEAGDLIAAVAASAVGWDAVVELAQIVTGRTPGRVREDEVTLFESQGIALEDVAAMKVAYERALELGVGEVLSRPPAAAGEGQ